MRILSILCLFCLSALVAFGQTSDEKPPLPAGPPIRAIQDFTCWQITYAYGNEKHQESASSQPGPSATPPPLRRGSVSLAAPKRVVVTRTKPFWMAVVENVDGRKYQQWSDGMTELFISDASPNPDIVPKDSDGMPLIPNYGHMGFPNVEWVSEKTYVGVQTVGGRASLVFKKDDMTVWVDEESRYPLRWQRGQEVRGFAQLAPPSGPISLPSEVAKMFEGLKRDRLRLATPYTP